jgi:xanthine dehydrogenase accessory factor
MDVFDALARARARGDAVVLVTVLDVSRDERSRAGAKVVVGAAGIVAGTLGCSEFDHAAMSVAGEALRTGEPERQVLQAPEGESPRWSIELFAEPQWPERAVIVLGVNPVARALCTVLRTIGRRVVLVDPAGATGVAAAVDVKADEPGRYLLAAPPGPRDAVVLADHDAGWVDEALRVALASEAFYVGLLGSRRHVPDCVRRLRESGARAERLARLRSPVGLDLGARTPEEIALAIAAEILADERGASGLRMTQEWAE